MQLDCYNTLWFKTLKVGKKAKILKVWWIKLSFFWTLGVYIGLCSPLLYQMKMKRFSYAQDFCLSLTLMNVNEELRVTVYQESDPDLFPFNALNSWNETIYSTFQNIRLYMIIYIYFKSGGCYPNAFLLRDDLEKNECAHYSNSVHKMFLLSCESLLRSPWYVYLRSTLDTYLF